MSINQKSISKSIRQSNRSKTFHLRWLVNDWLLYSASQISDLKRAKQHVAPFSLKTFETGPQISTNMTSYRPSPIFVLLTRNIFSYLMQIKQLFIVLIQPVANSEVLHSFLQQGCLEKYGLTWMSNNVH